jgi:flagellar hook-basal body complex protein FliE
MAIVPPSALGVGAADFATRGPEWSIEGVPGAAAGEAGGEQDFGGMLSSQLGKLTGMQEEAAEASRSLTDGTATDVSSVVMSVERARLAMQLAAQIRTKGVEAYQDVFHTQV